MDRFEVITGDALAELCKMPDQSVQCWVTSPPYWGLRDYGVGGQLGLEKTPEEYVAKMVEIFREARRVLRDDGTLWLNLGDTYAMDSKWGGQSGSRHTAYKNGASAYRNPRSSGCKNKDIVGIPWMVAFALRSDGWYLRQDIIWSKPNPMPESVKDRCTKSHEYLFLLSKSERYYFDQDAIKENCLTGDHPRNIDKKYSAPGQPQHTGLRAGLYKKIPAGWDTDKGSHGTIHKAGRSSGNKERKPRPGPKCHRGNQSGSVPREGETRNKRSVWTIPTKPFPQAHFATFPPALVEPCILAGCPEGGVVGDMFAGSGTTGIVALKHFRRFVGIELNPVYAKDIAIPRLEAEARRHKQLKII